MGSGDPYLNIDGQEVGYVEPDEALSNRVAGLSLKPEQKLKLLFEYVYPRYRYGMVLNPPSKTALLRQGVDKLKQAAISKEFQLWKALPCQGDGIEEFKNRQSNEWLCADGYLSSGRMVDALRMRTNTYGNRTTLIRAGHAHLSPLCRVCGDRPESLSHIVGGCPALKPRVIKRHDEIEAKRGAAPESTIHASEGMLKPDLIVVDRERVQVVDFTVRYEGTGKLEKAYMEKVAKYSELSTPLLNIFGDKQFEVIPIVVGARGALPIASIRG
nr:unnamed protein product [Callosobruchus analis]